MSAELFDPCSVPTGPDAKNKVGVVRVKRPERNQVEFRSDCLDDRIPEDHPVRTVWHFVEELDLSKIHDGFYSYEGAAGRSVTDRRVLFALWLHAYGEGIGSARRIHDLCQRDDSYRWLSGGVPLNYHTIADFRSGNGELLENLFVKSLAVLMNEGLIDVARLTNDGTKIRAKAKASSFRRESKLDALVEAAKEHIEAVDRENKEGVDASKREQAARARHARERLEKHENALKEMKILNERMAESNKKKKEQQVSTTEPEARFMKFGGSAAFHPAYNMQVASTLDTHVIVAIEPTQDCDDSKGLQAILPIVMENTASKPEVMVTDLGYSNRATMDYMEEQQVEFYAPEKPDPAPQAEPNYCRENADWNPDAKSVQCPEGHMFTLTEKKRRKSCSPQYILTRQRICGTCPKVDQCFPDGRKSVTYTDRKHAEGLNQKHNERINTQEGKDLLKLRFRGELQNAKVKQELGLRQFHVQGRGKVRQEALLVAMAHNLNRLTALRACAV